MKASELQIGDYVLVEGKPRRVEAITKKKIGYHTDNKYRLHYAKLHQIEPIEITKELLAESGFVENACYWDYRIDEHNRLTYYFHEHRVQRYWYGKDEWEKNSYIRDVAFMSQCWYLHQLQQACRMCNVEIDWNIRQADE